MIILRCRRRKVEASKAESMMHVNLLLLPADHLIVQEQVMATIGICNAVISHVSEALHLEARAERTEALRVLTAWAVLDPQMHLEGTVPAEGPSFH